MGSPLHTAHEKAEAQRIICGFCSRFLDASPTDDFLKRIITHRALLLEEPFSSLASAPARELHDLLDAVAGEGDVAFEEFFTQVRRDYTYLFYMVGVSATSPYESVYRTDDRTLYGPTTLAVRECYRAYGMQVAKEGSRPDDHIATELAFLECLLGLMSEGERYAETRLAAVDTAEKPATDMYEDIRSFLSDHVLVFAPLYCKNLQARAHEPLYRLVAAIASALLDSMAHVYSASPLDIIDEAAFLL